MLSNFQNIICIEIVKTNLHKLLACLTSHWSEAQQSLMWSWTNAWKTNWDNWNCIGLIHTETSDFLCEEIRV